MYLACVADPLECALALYFGQIGALQSAWTFLSPCTQTEPCTTDALLSMEDWMEAWELL